MDTTATIEHIERLLAHTPPFDRLAPEQHRQALHDVEVAYYAPDEVILPRGTRDHAYLYLVVSGHARLHDPETGALVDEAGEGDLFGAAGLLDGGALPYDVRAVEPTVCAQLKAARFRALCHAEPAFAAFFRSDLHAYLRDSRTVEDLSGARLFFQTPLRALVRRPPVQCPPETTARAAARRMRQERVGSILVTDGGRALGILTNTDLRDQIVADGRSPETPVADLMSRPLRACPAEAPVLEGLLAMMRHRMHHLVVTASDAPEAPVLGVISDQDVARMHGYNPVTLVKRIERARSVDELTGVRAELNHHLLRLHEQGLSADDLVAINSEVNDRLAVRVLRVVETRLRDEAPADGIALRWAWMALGSEGRREMSLRTDQDNALIYDNPPTEEVAERARRWFLRLAGAANDALARCGFALCPGEVMAGNPAWCRPLDAWKGIFRRWILDPAPRALMHASIFFDLRVLYGEAALVDALKDDLSAALRQDRGFLPFMMHNALTNRPPLSFFRRFVLDRSGDHRNTFDVKLRGLMPLVDLARILALEAGYLASTHTLDRLEHVRRALPDTEQTVSNATDAYRYLVERRLAHQLEALRNDEPPDNHINPAALSKVQQHMLKTVFGIIADMQDVLAHRYGAGMMRL